VTLKPRLVRRWKRWGSGHPKLAADNLAAQLPPELIGRKDRYCRIRGRRRCYNSSYVGLSSFMQIAVDEDLRSWFVCSTVECRVAVWAARDGFALAYGHCLAAFRAVKPSAFPGALSAMGWHLVSLLELNTRAGEQAQKPEDILVRFLCWIFRNHSARSLSASCSVSARMPPSATRTPSGRNLRTHFFLCRADRGTPPER
jgi:hypothetical protein